MLQREAGIRSGQPARTLPLLGEGSVARPRRNRCMAATRRDHRGPLVQLRETAEPPALQVSRWSRRTAGVFFVVQT